MSSIYTIGDWRVDPARKRISRGSEERTLQPLTTDILIYLAERPGEVVSGEVLLDTFWHSRVVGDDAVHRRIADIRRQLGDDAKRPAYVETVPKRGYRLIASVTRMDAGKGLAGKGLAGKGLADRGLAGKGLAPGAALGWLSSTAILLSLVAGLTNTPTGSADGTAEIAKARTLIEAGEVHRAFLLLIDLDADLEAAVPLLNEITLPVSLATDPDSVLVHIRPVASGADAWRALGRTPLESRLPPGNYHLRLGDTVRLTVTNPGVTLNNAGSVRRVIEMPVDPVPEDMTWIPGGHYRFGSWGLDEAEDLGPFLIDRFEVTNRQFDRFVRAGGYHDAQWWMSPADTAGTPVSPEILAGFVDRTGQPGPATWEFGTYPAGTGDLPVVGVSWFEARAYLQFVGKRLPSAKHWFRAALSEMEWKYPIAPTLVPASNIAGNRLAPVHSFPAAETNGAFDLVGNAAEWTESGANGDRVIAGSSFRDAAWAYGFPAGRPATLRSELVGFRGMRGPATEPINQTFPLFTDFRANVRQVSDTVFRGMSYAFSYEPGTISVADTRVVEEAEMDQWVRRRLVVPTGDAEDPLPVIVFQPKHAPPPWQSVLYIPPADSWSAGTSSATIAPDRYLMDFIPASGRALVWPVYHGSYERYDDLHGATGSERGERLLARNRAVRQEVGLVIDVLESDPLFDRNRIGLVALSHGAVMAAHVLALEPRIRAAALMSVGIAPPLPIFKNPLNDPNLFWARVRQPVLIMNGRYDPLRPHHFVFQPLLELLATSEENKRGVLYDSAHWPLPRDAMLRDVTAWFDQHLGPVQGE